jgi:hypothetical protein
MKQLLMRVAQRQRLILLGSRFHLFLLAGAGVYLLLVLVSRLLGVVPPWFTPLTLVIVPALALLLALVFLPRANPDDAARLIDTHLKTKDLFLTACSIDHSLGQYQPVVLAQAEQRAAGVKPAQVLHFRWERPVLYEIGALAAISLAVWFLPQFDPFGQAKVRQQLTQQEQQLQAARKATAVRAALLEKKTEGEHTEQVKAAVEDLKKTFLEAVPTNKTGTLAKLNEEQKQLGQLWKQLGEDKLKDALQRAVANQEFGLSDPAKARQMKSDLQQGDTSSVKKELNELKALADKLAATTDPVAREKLRQELANRLQDLRETVAQTMSSQPLDSALQRALEQLQAANQKGLSDEALKGLSESLNLSAEELRQLAQAAKDMQNVEDALKALQSAKRLHNVKPLDGSQCKNGKCMSDYASLFDSLYGSACKGLIPGDGMTGSGYGVGTRPHGDDTQQSTFHDERSTSAMQPGKMLLEWKTHELGDTGQAREEYLRAVSDVRQQASEAVLQEQIPPGYHAAIKNYFNTLSDDSSKPANP